VRECRQPRRCRIPYVVGRHEVESSRRFLGIFLGVASARKDFYGGCDESVGVRQIVCVREGERKARRQGGGHRHSEFWHRECRQTTGWMHAMRA